MKKDNKIIDFSPFVNISGEDNMVWRYLDYSQDFFEKEEVEAIKWHIENDGNGIFEIDYCLSDDEQTVVYRGKIPTREFFIELLKNIENFPEIERNK